VGIAAEAAERIRVAVAEMHLGHEGVGGGATVTVSLGVAAVVPGKADSAKWLIATADRNLYAAKQAGRNRVGVMQGTGSHERPE
jgi:diguanylate cyclase (GGDEF)-like protein